MAVKTKEVTNRRELRYASYDELLDDLDALTAGETEVLGNWSLAQICRHLASAFNSSIDGVSFRASWHVRVLAKTFLKKRFLHQKLSPGFKIPGSAKKQFEPEESLDLNEQAEALREAIGRVKSDKSRAQHPFFDQLSTQQWDQFNLRHAELHMSFVKPS